MQTIVTKYLGPGNVHGSRIQARTTSGIRKYFSYDDALSVEDNHRTAAQALADKLQWYGEWVEGAIGDGENVFVCTKAGEIAFRVMQ